MNTQPILEAFSFPVRYHKSSQSLHDSNGTLMLDVRGWAALQPNQQDQDTLGEMIAIAINEKWGNAKAAHSYPIHDPEKHHIINPDNA